MSALTHIDVYATMVVVSVSAVEEIVRDCLAVRVRLIARTVTGLYDGALDGHGLTIAQVNLLAALGKVGLCPRAKLGDELQLGRAALTRAGQAKIEPVMPECRQAQRQAAQLLGTSGEKAVRGIASSMGHLPGA